MAMTELETLRHSCAHVMATAVQQIFPDAQFGFGPPIDTGFYYDFDLPRPLTPEDLKEIEQRMRAITKAADPFVYEEISGDDALKLFRDAGQTYKVEAIRDLAATGETISIYRSGDFFDLCAGPHVADTRRVGVYKLLSIAGAYWKGDEKRPQLQRIYATAFPSKKDLKEYLHQREEALRRDHRTLARDLDLFSISPEVGAGLVLWHPKGGVLREIIEDFWRAEHRKRGYEIVYTPHIGRKELWETSGHTRWYAEGLLPEMELEHQSIINKPMNCPFHVKIFGSRTRSYRDLPIRMGELGTVYRFERSGVLHGALRVRGFTQDDAHIFCRPDQFAEEVAAALDIARFILGTFGFSELQIDLSVREEDGSDKYVGADEMWELAESGLVQALDAAGLSYTRVPGEAAFYGPKIDAQVHDAIGRTWQLTTVQVDFNLPERFDIEYEDEDGSRKRPVMVHRALLGSMERFVAILIEHYAGAFPVWIAPVQAMLIPIADRHHDYCHEAAERMHAAGLRVEVDARGERMNRKIRNAQVQKIPYMLVVGDRDIEAGQISVRLRSEQDLGAMDIDQFIAAATSVAADRSEGYGFDDPA